MEKKEEKEKKAKLSDLIFKIVFVFAIIFLIFSILKSPMANFSFTDKKLRTYKKKDKKNEKPAPAELKWQDSFKGISNSPKKENDNKYFK